MSAPSTPVSQATTLVLSPTPALRRGRAFMGLDSPKTPMKVKSPKTPVLPMKVQSPKTPKTPKSSKSGKGSPSSVVTPMKAPQARAEDDPTQVHKGIQGFEEAF